MQRNDSHICKFMKYTKIAKKFYSMLSAFSQNCNNAIFKQVASAVTVKLIGKSTLKLSQKGLNNLIFQHESILDTRYVNISCKRCGTIVELMVQPACKFVYKHSNNKYPIAVLKFSFGSSGLTIIQISFFMQAISKIFSAGLDITEFLSGDEARLREFWKSFQNIWIKLYGSNLATIAAVNVCIEVMNHKFTNLK